MAGAGRGDHRVLIIDDHVLFAESLELALSLEGYDVRRLEPPDEGGSMATLRSLALRANPRTVLLGTSSFWEGIDVVGDALSVLVIAKLPFSVPTSVCDAVIRAFAEHRYFLIRLRVFSAVLMAAALWVGVTRFGLVGADEVDGAAGPAGARELAAEEPGRGLGGYHQGIQGW